jgi:hypothetical protein
MLLMLLVQQSSERETGISLLEAARKSMAGFTAVYSGRRGDSRWGGGKYDPNDIC